MLRARREGLIDTDHIMPGEGSRQRDAAFTDATTGIKNQWCMGRNTLAFQTGIQCCPVVIGVGFEKRCVTVPVEQIRELLVDARLGAGLEHATGLHRANPSARRARRPQSCQQRFRFFNGTQRPQFPIQMFGCDKMLAQQLSHSLRRPGKKRHSAHPTGQERAQNTAIDTCSRSAQSADARSRPSSAPPDAP